MMKTIIAITLAAVGMLWARTAEAATVTSGFYTTTEEIQNGMVVGGMSSADNFTVTRFVVIPGVFLSPIDFRNGFLPGPVFPTFVPGAGVGADGDSMIGTITIPNASCGPPITKAAGCGVAMDFRFDPNTLGLPGGVTTLDE